MFTGGNRSFKTSLVAGAYTLLALAAQVKAHAIPVPALGVANPTRNDVKRPSTQDPCGGVNIAQNIDSSTATPANADGSFTIGVENFNNGQDGSTSVSVSVDASGAGTNFVAGTVTTNGNPNPQQTETDKVTFTLPAGTTCAGGAKGTLCLVSVKTTAGFGACTVVDQGGAAAGGAGAGNNAAAGAGSAATSTSVANASATTAASTGTTQTGTTGTGAATGKKGKHHKGAKGAAAKAGAAGKAAKAQAAKAQAAKVKTNAAIAKPDPCKDKKKVGRFAPAQLRRDSELELH